MNAPVKPYDVDAIRKDFPILSRTVYDKPLVYLDNAASAQKPRQVIDSLSGVYEHEYANVHRGAHYLSGATTTTFEESRRKAQKFINAPSEEEVIFTRGATEAINLVATSYGGEHIGEGDEIILSSLEHHSNIVPWHFFRERRGAVLKWIPIDDQGNLLVDEYEKLFTSKTKMVALTHMSNALGVITPLKEMIRIAHNHGVPVMVDGCQAAPHFAIDVQDLDADFYAFSGHKVYGPTGIGILYGKRSHLDAMVPYHGGGEMIREVTFDNVTYGDTPHKFEAGTPAIAQAIGLGAAIDYVQSIGFDAIHAHEQDLLDYAMDQLREFNWLKVFGATDNKGAIISFAVEGAHAHDVSTIIDRSGVAVRAGHHCAHPLMQRLGVDSTSRASFALYNTRAEVDAFVESLRTVRSFFA